MQRELDTAHEAARNAGQVLLQHYGAETTAADPSTDDPVTQADLESNEV